MTHVATLEKFSNLFKGFARDVSSQEYRVAK